MKSLRFLIVSSLFIWSSAWADDFPQVINLQLNDHVIEHHSTNNQQLRFNLRGKTDRSVLFFSIYDIALYVNDQSDELVAPYILSLRYSRDLSKSSIESALRKGLEKNSVEGHIAQIMNVFDQTLLPKLRDVNEGESLSLVRLSTSKAIVQINERFTGFLEGEQFLDALFSIWLGDKSVVSRKELFSISD